MGLYLLNPRQYDWPCVVDEQWGNVMKYILILILAQGVTTAQFDDRKACEEVIKQVEQKLGMDIVAYCMPQSSTVQDLGMTEPDGYTLIP